MPSARTPETPVMAAAALYYARRLRCAVVPLHHVQVDGLCSCGRGADCTSVGKHPRMGGWQNLASADPKVIEEWWARWPDANVGIATGAASGILVLDIDGEEGEQALAELEARHGALPVVPTTTTGRGRHMWFLHDERVKNSAKRLPKIDTRGSGGQVVAPPSMHHSGRRYAWVEGRTPNDVSPVQMPEWLVELLTSAKTSPTGPTVPARPYERPSNGDDHPIRKWCLRALEAEAAELARVSEGSRGESLNKSAYKLAGYVSSGAVDRHEIEAALVDASRANGLVEKDGLPSVLKTFARGYEAGESVPRDMPTPREYARNPAPPSGRATAAAGEPPDFGSPPPTDDDWDGGGGDGDAALPEIWDGPDENEAVALADEYLASDDELYQRGGYLVHVLRDNSPGAGVTRGRAAPRIDLISTPWLSALSSRRIHWMKKRKVQGEWIEFRVKPPDRIIRAVAGRGWWQHIRRLEGATVTPVLRPDGSIHDQSGYDPITGVVFDPYEAWPTVPAHPTRAHVDDAIETLRHVVVDFPFELAAHEAAWFAALLTPMARYAFRGPAPLFLIDATTAGTGKGLLARVAALIAIGQPPTIMTTSRDENEERKRITTIAMEGDAIVNIDNVEGRFGSPSFCAALTSDEWSDRVLGGSKAYKGPLLTTWMLTANNVQLTSDMIRRTAHIRLVTKVEKPEERTDFQIPDLEEYVRKHRARLACAALTILRGWYAAGRPKKRLPAWGSFEGWSAVVRQAIVWAGLIDPAETREALRASADSSTEQLNELLIQVGLVIPTGKKWTAGEVVERAKLDAAVALREALEAFGSRGAAPSAKSVGRLFLRMRGRIIGGRALQGEKTSRQWVWWVEGATHAPVGPDQRGLDF